MKKFGAILLSGVLVCSAFTLFACGPKTESTITVENQKLEFTVGDTFSVGNDAVFNVTINDKEYSFDADSLNYDYVNKVATASAFYVDFSNFNSAIPDAKQTINLVIGGYDKNVDGDVKASYKVSSKRIANSWEIEPSIQGWTWGQYEDTITPVGQAKYNNENMFIYYRLKTEDVVDNKVLPEDLSTMNAGEYFLSFQVPATDFYVDLVRQIDLKIERAVIPVTPPTDAGSGVIIGDGAVSSNVPETGYYSVENILTSQTGDFPVILSLKEPVNYCWADRTIEDKIIYFHVTRA